MVVPLATPVTVPDVDPIVAIPVDPDTHVPPPASLNAVVNPVQTDAVPEIAEGSGFTVTVVVVLQPEPTV